MLLRRRMLLVEFVNADQFPGRISYNLPFLSGFYRNHGWPTRWVRFGISTTNLLQHGRDQITLSDAELAHLLDVVREHRPTQLVLTDELYEAQLDAIRAVVPKLPKLKVILAKESHWWQRFLRMWTGLKDVLLAGVAPHYRWEPGNEAARTRKIDNVYLVQVESCGHRCAIAENPIYRGVGDRKTQDHMGCAFCENWKGRKRTLPWYERMPSPFRQRVIDETPDEWIDRQLEALARTRGDEIGLPNGVLLEQLLSTRIFRRCLETMQRLGMVDQVKLLIAVRAAQSPVVGRLLDQHFERHPESKLEVGVYASGIESFDGRDLQLLNKGTRPLDGLRAVNTFRALKARYSGQFWFTGLSFILFTPWTTLEGLHLNMGLIRYLGLSRKVAGNMFQARLRLHYELPITRLAERDGLLVEDESDPVMVMNRRKLFGSERAWRFADERLRPISRIVLRFDLFEDAEADELTRELRAGLQAVDRQWSSGDDPALQGFMLALIEETLAEPEPLEESELVRRGLARWKARRAQEVAPPAAARYRIGERMVDAGELAGALGGLVAAGSPEVAIVRGVSAAELEGGVEQAVRERGVVCALIDERGRKSGTSGTLVIAGTPEILERRIALRADIAGDDPEAGRAAIAAVAELQGAPACCARAAAADPAIDHRLPIWAALRRRAEEPGPAPASMVPVLVPALAFAPCRIDCEEAAARTREWHDALGLAAPEERERPVHVFGLTGPGDGELVTVAARRVDGDRISWGDGATAIAPGDGELRARLREADEMQLVPGQLRLFRAGRLVDVATMTHAVWSTERCWHPKETVELARATSQILDGAVSRDHLGTPESEGFDAFADAERGADDGEIGGGDGGGSLREEEARHAAEERGSKLRSLADAIGARYGDRFGQLSVTKIGQPEAGGAIALELAIAGQPYQLSLGDPEAGARYMFRTDGFAVSHAAATPLETDAHRRVIVAWVKVLDRAVRAYAPELFPGAAAAAAAADASSRTR